MRALVYVWSAVTVVTTVSGVFTNVSHCLQRSPVQDLNGDSVDINLIDSRPLVIPDSCENTLCSGHSVLYHNSRDTEEGDGDSVIYLSFSMDEHQPESAACVEDMRSHLDVRPENKFPVQVFSTSSHVRLVVHDSRCPAVQLRRRRLLLLALLRATSVQQLETMILCDWQLQSTPVVHHKRSSPAKPDKRKQLKLLHQKSSDHNEDVTYVTLYSGIQARTALTGFVPQYARFNLADNLVVSVMSSCTGDQKKMDFINQLGAKWSGKIDSCLRLLCHSTTESLALGYYKFVIYEDQKEEGEACFRALETNNIGSTVKTPLTQVRIVSLDDDSCSGNKIMVLNPGYSGTSFKLQRFLYYQAYKMHSFKCPELADSCLEQKMARFNYNGITAPYSSKFPYHCSNLLCDSHVNLIQSPIQNNVFQVWVENDKMRPLNNVCFKALSREKQARTVGDPSVQVRVPKLGIYLQFGLL